MTKKGESKWSENPYLQWLDEVRGLSDNTIYIYGLYYKHLGSISQRRVSQFLMSKKNNSISRSFVKSLLEFFKENGQEFEIEIPQNKTGKKPKRIIRDLSPEQIKKIRDYSYNKNFMDGVLFDLLYYGALRREEIVTIRVNSFDWSTFFDDHHKHCKLIVLGKGKKHREVLVHPDTIGRILERYKKVQYITDGMTLDYMLSLLTSNDALLFKSLYRWKVWKIIKRNSLNAIGIGVRPHELRHTRATELEKKGASIRSVQHYLGHSNPQITEIYLHTTQTQSLQKVMDIVND